LSPDGLPLAVHPAAEEDAVVAVWSRLAALGQVSRGFVTVRSEVWAFVQGERYGALVLADRTVRPGQVLEMVDQVLAEAASAAVLAGGADRRLEGAAGQRERTAARRFRMPLHPDERESDVQPIGDLQPAVADAERISAGSSARAENVTSSEQTPAAIASDGALDAGPSVELEPQAARSEVLDAQPMAEAIDVIESQADVLDPSEDTTADPAPSKGRAGGAVDIIALAREFAGLLSERDDGPA
jgi:hypothetical protein